MTKHPFFLRLFPNEVKAHKAYHRQVQTFLPAKGKVLDLGCGDHAELAEYRSREREVWGTDFQCHPRLEYPQWFRLLGPDGAIPFATQSFDLVAASWVLEHVEEPAHFLSEVSRVLRPGGWFVALTVNGEHYVSLLARLLGWLPLEWTQLLVRCFYGRPGHDTFRTHYRLNTARLLQRAANASGLELTRLSRHVNPTYFGRMWRLAVLVDWLLEGIRPGLGRIYLVATFQKPAATARRLVA